MMWIMKWSKSLSASAQSLPVWYTVRPQAAVCPESGHYAWGVPAPWSLGPGGPSSLTSHSPFLPASASFSDQRFCSPLPDCTATGSVCPVQSVLLGTPARPCWAGRLPLSCPQTAEHGRARLSHSSRSTPALHSQQLCWQNRAWQELAFLIHSS